MEGIQLTNLIWFLVVGAVVEVISFVVNCKIKRRVLKKWVDSCYPSLRPSSFTENWFNDLRFYILFAFLVIYSFLGKHDILIVALINIYLIVNAMIHLTMRWSKIISFFEKLQTNENGEFIYKTKKDWNWGEIYLMSVRNWLNKKIKKINKQTIKGIEICQQNRFEGCYYLDKNDVLFSRDEFINMDSQSSCSNRIFLCHLFAVIVANSALLFDMVSSGMVTMADEAHNVEDVLYVILQVFSTVGFGDIHPTTFLGKCFFVIMFFQVIATIVLGVAYKDFALNRAAIRFDKMAKLFNDVIGVHKKRCIDIIFSKQMPFDSLKGFHEGFPLFSQSVFEKLREYADQKDGEQNSATAQSQN